MCLDNLKGFPLPKHAYKVVEEEVKPNRSGKLFTRWMPCYLRCWGSKRMRRECYYKRLTNKDRASSMHTLYTAQGELPYTTGFHLWVTLKGALGAAFTEVDCGPRRIVLKVTYDDVVATGYQWHHRVIVARSFKVVKKVKTNRGGE